MLETNTTNVTQTGTNGQVTAAVGIDQSKNNSLNEYTELFQIQRANKTNLRNSTAEYRVQKLVKLREAILNNLEKIEAALFKDFHKPQAETLLAEVMPVVAGINKIEKKLKKWMKPNRVSTPPLLFGSSAHIRKEAKGQILVISPWNYPFQLALYPVITAFAAGNTVILKPSSETTNINNVIKELIESVFNLNEVAVVLGTSKESNKLLEHPFNHVFFTGSTRVGRIIMEKASKHLASVTLELGGKSPTIIDQSVTDLYDATHKILWGKLLNSGQTCVAPDFLFIHKSKLQEFIQYSKHIVNDFYEADEANTSDETKFNYDQLNSYTHIVNTKQMDRLQGYLGEVKDQPDQVITFSSTDSLDKTIAPTYIINPKTDALVLQEEIFGPLLPIITFEHTSEIADFMRDKETPLAMYIYANDQSNINYYLNEVQSGGVCLNDNVIHLANSNLPFGGHGESGMGHYHGYHGFLECSYQRSVLTRKFNAGASFFFPPYSKKKTNFIRSLIKNFPKFF